MAMTSTREAVEAEETAQQQRLAEMSEGDRALLAAAKADYQKMDARVAIREDQKFWTPVQIAGLRALGVRSEGPLAPTNADLAIYFHVCVRTGLDPFTRQIYLIPRRTWNSETGDWEWRQTIQVGIDGFRVQRERAARRGGHSVEFEGTVWYDRDGGEHTVWLDDDAAPVACKVVLLKDGHRFPAVLRTAAYMAFLRDGKTPAAQWKTQADHMIEKCCEAFASRRAFPADLGGLYIQEEMMHDSPMTLPERGRPARLAPEVTDVPDEDPAERRRKRLHALFGECGLAGDVNRPVKLAVCRILAAEDPDGGPAGPITSTLDLSDEQVERVVAKMKVLMDDRGHDLPRLRESLVKLARVGGWAGKEEPAWKRDHAPRPASPHRPPPGDVVDGEVVGGEEVPGDDEAG